MISSTAGLKEFGDGDVTLFNGNGNLMIEVTPDEDFEAEFRKVLMCEGEGEGEGDTMTMTMFNYKSSSLIGIENDDQISISTNRSSSTNLLHTNLNLSMTDFYATPPETDIMKFESVGPIKFEEDPLSEYLNLRESTQIQSSSVVKKKRGRPVSIKFKASDQQYETTEKLKLKTLKPRSSNTNTNTKTNTTTNININYSTTSTSTSKLQLRDRRSDDDHYTPIWIRGRGSEREGLCPLCNPSVWLKIKQSAYWYHMNFFHGICAATGRQYKRPIEYRLALVNEEGTKRIVEGHCGTCLQWIQIASEYEGDGNSRSLSYLSSLNSLNLENEICFNSWYKHAQKCHHRIKEFQIPEYL